MRLRPSGVTPNQNLDVGKIKALRIMLRLIPGLAARMMKES